MELNGLVDWIALADDCWDRQKLGAESLVTRGKELSLSVFGRAYEQAGTE